jgi:NADH dehydrogenase [ubiquinone] 1 alpha subcomplex assembly factor 7
VVPERLDHFMARANARYYATHDPFRDFTTAPEIGQVFGELLGAWAAVMWQSMGAPDPFLLVEAGPGRGTLMADLLRIGRVAPAFRAAARVHFIETSPRLRAAQLALVPDAVPHDSLSDVPDGPLILLANEFLDALPVRQFEYRRSIWLERHVDAGGFVTLPAEHPPRFGPAQEGEVREVNEAACAWASAVAGRVATHGGAALILDYGSAAAGQGDTVQALRDSRPANPLADPGEADLTAHVDFAALLHAVRDAGAATHGPVPQGAFLHALGLRVRTERLAASHPARAAALRDAADRLANPSRMGSLFQVLCLTLGQTVPPGFALGQDGKEEDWGAGRPPNPGI